MLHLRADGIDGDKQHHQCQHTRHQRIVQIDRIVEPRVVQGMCLQYHGLQHRLRLPRFYTVGIEQLHSNACICQFREGTHILVE